LKAGPDPIVCPSAEFVKVILSCGLYCGSGRSETPTILDSASRTWANALTFSISGGGMGTEFPGQSDMKSPPGPNLQTGALRSFLYSMFLYSTTHHPSFFLPFKVSVNRPGKPEQNPNKKAFPLKIFIKCVSHKTPLDIRGLRPKNF
jgi:hypothetical protein